MRSKQMLKIFSGSRRTEMENELTIIAIILAGLAVNYLWVYPKIAGDDVRKMAWLDAALSLLVFGIVAIFFFGSDERFNLLGFETNWAIFTLVVGVVIELPLFYWYLKARGLGNQYREAFGFGARDKETNWFTSTSVKSVEKQLNDTKWDGLRTPKAKRILVIGSNLVILFGTGFLFGVGDNLWSSYAVIHIILIFAFWFLLRQSVRLVADAPDAALDERMIAERDRSYFEAYRLLGGLILTLATALMVFAIISDARNTSVDAFYYNLELTWPQVQGLFWITFGYAMMLPSMAMAWRQTRRQQQHL
jgi:hypothetical protein